MTDIDRRLRQVDHISPPDLWDQIEGRHPRQTPPPGGRSRVVTVALALALAATGIFFVTRAFELMPGREATPGGWEGSDELKIPPLGEASAEFLADGRPVWVVHHEDGTVSVFDGFSTHRPWGVQELVGWCASGRYFEELAHGASYNENGLWLDGPGTADLAFFETQRTPGGIRVGVRVEPKTRSAIRPGHFHSQAQPSYQGPACYTAGMVPGPPPPQMHEFPESPTYASPAGAIEAQPNGWIKLHGVLLVQRDEPTYLCVSAAGDSCTSPASVEGFSAQKWLRGGPIDITDDGEWIYRPEKATGRHIFAEGQWIARVEGDHLTDLTLLGPPGGSH